MLLILGCVLAAFAKLTATILMLGFALAFIVLRWWAVRQRPDMRVMGLFFASEAVACGFYVSFLIEYGTPAPLSPHFEEVYRSVADFGRICTGGYRGKACLLLLI